MSKVKSYFVQGQLTARFSGVRIPEQSGLRGEKHEVRDLLNTQIYEIKKLEDYNAKYHTVDDAYLHFDELNGVIIQHGKDFFRTNLKNAYINDIHIDERGKDGEFVFGRITGTVTGTIERPDTQTVLPQIHEYELNSEPQKFVSVNNTSGVKTQFEYKQKKIGDTNEIVRRRYIRWSDVLKWILGLILILCLAFFIPKIFAGLLIFWAVIFILNLFSKHLSVLLGVLIGFAVLLWLFAGLKTGSGASSTAIAGDDAKETTEVKPDPTGDGQTSDSMTVVQHRIWNDYTGNRYEADLSLKLADYFSAKRLHSEITADRFDNAEDFWNHTYSSLSDQAETQLGSIFKTFDSIGKVNRLDQTAFAQMVVSCIQDIPYCLIVSSDCNQYRRENPQDVDLMDRTGCFGPAKYGVQAPAEFIFNLKGDCDTRTVMCYTILKHYGYNVAILSSEQYRHSLLGIDMPADGTYKQYAGRRYYLWETTAKACVPGFVAPDFSNLNYWNFTLVSS